MASDWTQIQIYNFMRWAAKYFHAVRILAYDKTGHLNGRANRFSPGKTRKKLWREQFAISNRQGTKRSGSQKFAQKPSIVNRQS